MQKQAEQAKKLVKEVYVDHDSPGIELTVERSAQKRSIGMDLHIIGRDGEPGCWHDTTVSRYHLKIDFYESRGKSGATIGLKERNWDDSETLSHIDFDVNDDSTCKRWENSSSGKEIFCEAVELITDHIAGKLVNDNMNPTRSLDLYKILPEIIHFGHKVGSSTYLEQEKKDGQTSVRLRADA